MPEEPELLCWLPAALTVPLLMVTLLRLLRPEPMPAAESPPVALMVPPSITTSTLSES